MLTRVGPKGIFLLSHVTFVNHTVYVSKHPEFPNFIIIIVFGKSFRHICSGGLCSPLMPDKKSILDR